MEDKSAQNTTVRKWQFSAMFWKLVTIKLCSPEIICEIWSHSQSVLMEPLVPGRNGTPKPTAFGLSHPNNTILLILLPLSWGLLPKVTIINDLSVKHITTHHYTQAIQVIVCDLESAVQDHNQVPTNPGWTAWTSRTSQQLTQISNEVIMISPHFNP